MTYDIFTSLSKDHDGERDQGNSSFHFQGLKKNDVELRFNNLFITLTNEVRLMLLRLMRKLSDKMHLSSLLLSIKLLLKFNKRSENNVTEVNEQVARQMHFFELLLLDGTILAGK